MSSTPDEPIKPIILDGYVESGSYQTATTATVTGIAMRAPSSLHAGIRGGVAALLIVLGIGNFVAATGFPYNAPVEMLFMFLLSLDMFIAAVVLIVFAVLAGARRSVPVLSERTSPLSIAGLVVSGVAFVAWVLFGLVPTLGSVGSGEDARYMTLVGVLVFFGVPWILGLVFGTISLRSGGPRTWLFGCLAAGLGVLLAFAVLAATILYGLGLTE
ncbi:hypothetical protein PYV02_10425 [Leifsonia sp. H3M29-4]|uniref:hypothetical protein n=1 Tax=Salinibacterium metalliresistens TaxID=3031321 RepID=UPI0023DBF1A1|nr:hypothetical protein [Salinibacterium metalliresistens]MDF1479496.1 hypothetical protein [Salinibacterium metalliresistens]